MRIRSWIRALSCPPADHGRCRPRPRSTHRTSDRVGVLIAAEGCSYLRQHGLVPVSLKVSPGSQSANWWN